MELLSRYNTAVDEGYPDAVADCFTADGYINGRSGHSIGTEELKLIGTKASPTYQARHVLSNILIAGRSEKGIADVRSHLFFYEVRPSGMTFVCSGIYTDVVVKDHGEWRFKSRVMTPAIGEVWPGQKL